MKYRDRVLLSGNRDLDVGAVLNQVIFRGKVCDVLVDFQPPPYGADIWLEFDDAPCVASGN